MKTLKTFTFLLLIGIASLCAAQQSEENGVADQLKQLRAILDQNMEMIDVDFLDLVDKCRNAYAASLQSAEETATQKGDLDAVVQIRKEKKRFATDRAVDDEIPAGTHPLIKEAIESYLSSLEKADSIRAQNAAVLARKYLDRLQSMQKSLTREKKIDDALTVQNAIRKAKADPALMSALSTDLAASGPAVCPACNGKKLVEATCPDCNGTGACSYCEGTGIRKGLGGKGIPCFACTGNKKCKKCGGTGKIAHRCARCNGTGRIK